MRINDFFISGVLEFVPVRIEDERGHFSEIFRREVFSERIGPVDFVQENESLSVRQGTIRGIHFQTAPFAQGKLVRCVAGAIFDVAVDLRINSPTFGQHVCLELSSRSGNQLWIPAGFGHAFCTLTPNSLVSYKVTERYSQAHDAGVIWDDDDIAISWPSVADPDTLSPKDRNQPRLSALDERQLF
ncbi:dTDP-4-dehydrorhamnose 3,5-epimerase [Novosphingobium jiangmenense]|uniref:dTDP-4-dehydrorhamnose 3,5-epimerase n=1 Tax=Novosphingobium jiangmenense TaxID=2791981 RepID=A0ABS0HLD2_9SPHN|nr:dTDP-4-dehydrorhamnose 3,5-epimerase [Novosphingobium jiangmenense]MBF9153067.1 dTDP-4-dehydrorhamnose 3,5-epimerase [Novosphingobium jiangmenense]